MESIFWQFDNEQWICRKLKSKIWLLEPSEKENALSKIHKLTRSVQKFHPKVISDFIPAYESLTLILNEGASEIQSVLDRISEVKESNVEQAEVHTIPVCYDLGLDWDEVQDRTNLSKDEIIKIHSEQKYTVAMLGFLPGFVFLEGLDERIHVKRKGNPRTKIPAGSVAIGGHQTGMYSLESPGGWQIIGRTSESFFDILQKPPTTLKQGDKVIFEPISKDEFRSGK